MPEQKHSWLEDFIALTWYEAFLRFIANFIAKSSEILLTAGLVVSTANFLSDGGMLKDGTSFAMAWAWAQAIAIDGSLGVSFLSVFQSLKQRDWIKFILYSILTILLTLVAWFVTEGDIFSHAVNTSSQEAMQLIGINVRLLSTLRAIAVVGFVLMSRLRDVTLWESIHKSTSVEQTKNDEKHISEEDLEQLIQNVLQKRFYNVTITPENNIESIITSQKPTQHIIPEKTSQHDENSIPTTTIQQNSGETLTENQATQSQVNEENHLGQEERIVQAYHELKHEGQHISGRTLAQRAHVRRVTCLEWLRSNKQLSQKQENHTTGDVVTRLSAQISTETPNLSFIEE